MSARPTAEKLADRLPGCLAREVPQRDVDRADDVERERRAPVVRRAVVQQAPQPGGIARVLSDQQLPRATADGVRRGHLDHRPGQVRRRVRLPDPDEALVGVHADEECVLGAVGAIDVDLGKANDDRFDVGDAHQNVTVRPPSTVTTWPVTYVFWSLASHATGAAISSGSA